MKTVGLMSILLGAVSMWIATSEIFEGAHATNLLWRYVEPLSDAAVETAKTPEDRRQRYAEIATLKKELETFVVKADSARLNISMVLGAFGLMQSIAGLCLLLQRKKPNQSARPNAHPPSSSTHDDRA